MNIFVCIKQTPDTETRIKPSAGNQGLDLSAVKWIVSPFDEYAVEEGLRVRDAHPVSAVTVLSAGPVRAVEAIRSALAMGADHGIHIELPETADNHMTARALAEAIKREPVFDLVLCGKQAIDDGSGQVGQLLAMQLGIPCVSFVVKTRYGASGVVCSRAIDGGVLELVETAFPVLITAQRGLNEPRYATLPNMLKAKKKEVKMLKASELGITSAEQKIRFKDYRLPPPGQGCKKIEGTPEEQARELVRLLHEEARVV
ncbi:MAG: hypothetical protein A2583_14895 [Bdellovibrionales bacterium RIFOXYD1_FULL_53_11]|nr:MAG: hypothetical protein A2583_14895 [Bdellovibrionales bacterium RIFOXYD1_FULL_53_11]